MTKTPKIGMKPPLDFYFDFSSPYGYIASEKIEALAAKHDRGIDWHPILLGIGFKRTGGAPLTELPLKGAYSKRDFVRSVAFHGVERFRLPSTFPIRTQAPARLVLWLKARDAALATGGW
jgi:2-hydroxychromene-2-carboxylate isomerase